MFDVSSASMHDVKITPVYMKNFNAKTRMIINRGGARSSKSYSILQLLLSRLITCKSRRILVLRKSMPFLRISTLQTWRDILSDCKITDFIKEKVQMCRFEYGESFVQFGSLDDKKGMEKIKSSEWNDILLEETTEFREDEALQMLVRLSAKVGKGEPRNQLFFSFNPILEYHWIKTKVIDNPAYKGEFTEIVSTYKDNPFLTEDYIKGLEDLAKKDKNFHRVYTLGEWGSVEGMIYSTWNIIKEVPQDYRFYVYGLDFGYSSSETALIKIYFYDNKEKYGENFVVEEEIIYQKGLSNNELIDLLHKKVLDKGAYIYADCQEPDRIADIKKAGFRNIKKAKKNVLPGINRVKDFSVNIVENSVNIIKEKSGYCWAKDSAGNYKEEPVKFNDHLMDAERYALFTHKGFGNKGFHWI